MNRTAQHPDTALTRGVEFWRAVEIRHLAALAAVDQERSFRGAADQLGYVQSAVSQQISRLEAIVGVRLVERVRGRPHVDLTPAGRVLLHHGHRILGQMQAAQADLQRLADRAEGSLHVGAFQSAAIRIVPTLIAHLARARPDIDVMLHETRSDEQLFAMVDAGELDVAFAELPLEPGPFAFRALMSEPCVLLTPQRLGQARADAPPTLAEIVELPLVAHPGWRMGSLVENYLSAAGHAPRYRFRAETDAAIHALVAGGSVAAVVPRLSADRGVPGVEHVELGDVLPRRTLGVFWHEDRVAQLPLEPFIGAAERACAQAAWSDGERRREIAA